MSKRDVADLLDEARDLGFDVSRAARHWRLALPGGPTLFVCKTPSDHRSVANSRAQMKRALRTREQSAIIC